MNQYTDLIDNRHIRVFISSTFKGMYDERDELINKVFPMLRRKAMERGVVMTDVDLRWGITPDESQSGKVVEICLQEIENSIPFFIGIVGDRYGWIPCRDDLTDNTIESFPPVNAYLEKRLSVTEMEMQYGVLERPNTINAYFYVKDGCGYDSDESQFEHDKLDDLRKEVISNNRYPVKSYTSPLELSRLVESDFSNLLDQLYPEAVSQEEIDDIAQRMALKKHRSCYVSMTENTKAINDFIENDKQHVLLVTGTSGSGKSAFLANWIGCCNFETIYHDVSIGSRHECGFAMMRRLLRLLGSVLNVQVDLSQDFEKTSAALHQLVIEADQKGYSLPIIIDGLEYIPKDNLADTLSWIPKTLMSVKIICACRSESYIHSFLANRGYPSHVVTPLGENERLVLVRSYLEFFHRKHLESYQEHKIASSTVSQNPAVLHILLDELANFGIHEQLDDYISHLVSCDSEDAFYERYLEHLETCWGERLTRDFFSLLLMSREGVKEVDLIQLLKCSRFQLSQILGYLIDSVSHISGMLLISNSALLKAANRRYISEYCRESHYRGIIIEYYLAQNDRVALREVVFQYMAMREWARLQQYISSVKILHALYGCDYDNLFFICSRLQRELSFSLDSYKEELKTLTSEKEYAYYLMELASLANMMHEMSSMVHYADLLLAEVNRNNSSMDVHEKRMAVHCLYQNFTGIHWYYEYLVILATKELELVDTSKPFDTLDGRNKLAIAYQNRFKLKDSKSILDDIIEKTESITCEDSEKCRHLADYYAAYAGLYLHSTNSNHLEKNAEYSRKSYECAVNAFGEDSREMISYNIRSALSESLLQNRNHAELLYNKAEEICRFYFGDDSPQMEECVAHKIKVYQYLHDKSKMLEALDQAMPLFATAPKRPGINGAFYILDGLMWASLESDVRVKISEAEVALFRKFYGVSQSLALKIHDLGDALSSNRQYADALDSYEEALSIMNDTYNKPDKDADQNNIVWCYDGIINCCAKLGQKERGKIASKNLRSYMKTNGIKGRR